jgi:MFS family permease
MALWVKHLGYSTELAGIAVALFYIGVTVSSLLGGSLSDRFTPRFTIVLSLIIAAVTALAFIEVHTIEGILLIAPIAGLSGFYRPAARALIVEIAKPEDQLAGQGLFTYAANLGFVFSGVLGGFLAAESFNLVFAVDAISSLIFVGIALLWLPSGTVTVEHGRASAHLSPPRKNSILEVLRQDRPFVLFLLAYFFGALALSQWMSGIPLQIEAYGHSVSLFGVLWSASAVWMLVLQIPVLAYVNRFPNLISCAVSTVVIGIGAAFFAISGSPLWMFAAVSIMTIGEIVLIPAAYAHAANVSPAGFSGRYQGAALTAFWGAFVVGPTIGSFLFSIDNSLLWTACLVASCVGAIFALLSSRAGEPEVSAKVEDPTVAVAEKGT